RTFEVFRRDRLTGAGTGAIDSGAELALLALDQDVGVDIAVIETAVLLLLDLEDVGSALDAGEKVLAIIAVEELGESLDALDDHQEIVLSAKRKDRIDEVMAQALVAQIDLQAIGEEGKEIRFVRIGM